MHFTVWPLCTSHVSTCFTPFPFAPTGSASPAIKRIGRFGTRLAHCGPETSPSPSNKSRKPAAVKQTRKRGRPRICPPPLRLLKANRTAFGSVQKHCYMHRRTTCPIACLACLRHFSDFTTRKQFRNRECRIFPCCSAENKPVQVVSIPRCIGACKKGSHAVPE